MSTFAMTTRNADRLLRVGNTSSTHANAAIENLLDLRLVTALGYRAEVPAKQSPMSGINISSHQALRT